MIQTLENLPKTRVKLTVPLIASYLSCNYHITSIARATGQGYQWVGEFVKKNYDDLYPLLITKMCVQQCRLSILHLRRKRRRLGLVYLEPALKRHLGLHYPDMASPLRMISWLNESGIPKLREKNLQHFLILLHIPRIPQLFPRCLWQLKIALVPPPLWFFELRMDNSYWRILYCIHNYFIINM